MRIIKYLFLLLLLSSVAMSIFIATQKGDYYIERTKIINSSKTSVYNFVNEYKNWEDFESSIIEDEDIQLIYADKTIGTGASYSWEGSDGDGTIKTILAKDTDIIIQKLTLNKSEIDLRWFFKDTLGSTKVTCKTRGKMDFFLKIHSILYGGTTEMIGNSYEKTLNNLDKALDYEINTYHIKNNGVVKRPTTFYLSKTLNCEKTKVATNAKIIISTLTTYCEENDITVYGKPFVLYHSYDLEKGTTKISICLPIKTEIFISPGSDFVSGKLEAMQAVKTTLYGEYSHLQEAKDKAIAFLNKYKLKANPIVADIESYKISKIENKKPSKWVTEIFIPIQPKVLPPKKVYRAPVTPVAAPVRRKEVPVNIITPVTIEDVTE